MIDLCNSFLSGFVEGSRLFGLVISLVANMVMRAVGLITMPLFLVFGLLIVFRSVDHPITASTVVLSLIAFGKWALSLLGL